MPIKRGMRTLGLFLLLMVGAPVAAATFSIPLTGALEKPLSIDAALMRELPRQSIEASDHGKPARFEGVWLRDVLARAGAPLGQNLRGRHLALCLRISARDAYVAVYALAELDPGFRDKPILLADRREGQPLSAEEGPLRLVVADEARGARWIRQIQKIELIDLAQ